MKQDLKKEKKLLIDSQSNKEKYGDLYKYFVNDIYRFSYSLLGNKEDAEDITSRVFIKFYENLDKYEWKNISLKSWFFNASRKMCYEKFREKFHEEYKENLDIEDEYEISFVDKIMNLELVEKVKEEIKSLSSIEREIINLRIWEGMQFNEIAKLQDSNTPKVKMIFYRSIEKIKKSLESKKIRSILALPLLFTTIKQVGLAKAYHAPISLLHNDFSKILNNNINNTQQLVSKNITRNIMDNTITTNSSFLASKAGIAVIGILTASILVVGGIALTKKNYNTNKNNNNNPVVTPTAKVTTNPTSTPTSSVTNNPTTTNAPTTTVTTSPTVTETAAPTLTISTSQTEVTLSTYTDKDFGFKFDYPSSWTINEGEATKTYRDGDGAVNITKTIEIVNSDNSKLVIKLNNAARGCMQPSVSPQFDTGDLVFQNTFSGFNILRNNLWYQGYSSPINGEGYISCMSDVSISTKIIPDNGTGSLFFSMNIENSTSSTDLSLYDNLVKSLRF